MKLTSKYISDDFRNRIWPCFEEEFADRQHTLKNYKNVLQAFCEYIGRDFLEARESDLKNYYLFLSVKNDRGTMSARSVLTYKKTLRAIACKTEEYIEKNDLPVFFLNIFRDTVAGDVRKIRDDMWIAGPGDVEAVLAQSRKGRDMLLLLLLSEGALNATQISALTWEDLVLKEGGKWLAFDPDHGFYLSPFMELSWQTYLQQQIEAHSYKPRGRVFTTRTGRPIDTKTISTIVKRFREKAGIEKKLTARELRDYALLVRLDELLTLGEEKFEKKVILDEAQKRRMRELYQWMIAEKMIEAPEEQ